MPVLRYSLLLSLVAVTAACQEDPLPTAPAPTQTTKATQHAKRGVEEIEAEKAKLEKQIADLTKKATRTYAMDRAKQINKQIEARKKRLAQIERELAAAQ